MAEANNVLLLAGEALLYFTALGALLRARTRIGLGAFFCALGVMHFLETYLAGTMLSGLGNGTRLAAAAASGSALSAEEKALVRLLSGKS